MEATRSPLLNGTRAPRRQAAGQNVYPTLLNDLERLVSQSCRGNPESLLLWTSRSVRHLAQGLREQGHAVHFTTVAKLLALLGYSLQANVKTRE
ncbi:MAG: ISAzo13 family transposase, partial [Actinobacteria bacterium]|nr:ISAzo13 family transposase [Actinomycetota bacterium]